MSDLWSISPIDGRYKNSTEEFRNYFSEAALIKYRIIVECEYFISLCEVIPPLFNSRLRQKPARHSGHTPLKKTHSRQKAQCERTIKTLEDPFMTYSQQKWVQ